MEFEPTTLRDLVGRSNHLATGDSMVSTGQMWVLTRTASRSHIVSSWCKNFMLYFYKRLTWWLDGCISDMPQCDCAMQLWVMCLSDMP